MPQSITESTEFVDHRFLSNGLELATLPLKGRSLFAVEMRVFVGYTLDPPDQLGLAGVLGDTISKGTEKRDGRALNDAFDAIGATHAVRAGRESMTFSCQCLAEFAEPAVDLLAEMIRMPVFPEEVCAVAVELAGQAQAALKDDPHELAKKYLHRQAYGDPLGRHILGEPETLENIDRDHIVAHWKRHFASNRIQVAVAGAIEPSHIADLLSRAFEGFHCDGEQGLSTEGRHASRPGFELKFKPGYAHYEKDVEQDQLAICYPGARASDSDEAVERVALSILSGGMSCRLWTHVRERLGLVYWVGAWTDRPRNAGLVHLGASTTAKNLRPTYETILSEVEALAQNVTSEEVQRAITGITASMDMQGDVTRAKTIRLANDLFYLGQVVPLEEKLARITRVKVGDVKRYLEKHPRDQLSVVTLGRGDWAVGDETCSESKIQ